MNRILVALIPLGLSACGGSDSSFPNPAAPSVSSAPALVTRLRIEGNMSLTTVGETSQLAATATFSDGTEKNVTAETAWNSTEPSVVTVAAGLLTVRRFGVAIISARYQTTGASVSLRPTPPGTFVIYGRAREPGQGGLSDVTVTDAVSLSSVQTEADGGYFLTSLPRSETRLRFTRSEYEPLEMNATQAFGDAAMQRIIRVRAGETVRSLGFAPNDLTYTIGGDRCSPCRLVRVVADAAATFHFRVTWSEPRVTLSLWANGSVTTGSTSELEADVPVPAGESIVYLGVKPAPGNIGTHMPFTIETTVK